MDIKKIIKNRKSVRTYLDQPISEEIRNKIEKYITKLNNPWGVKINYTLIDNVDNNNEKLGTYGVIRNAKSFIAATLVDGEFSLEALGYELEELILYLTSIGLGTCWLGGTFNRGAFAKEANVKEGEIIPIITPVGYPAQKMSLTEKMMRKISKGDQRKDWEQLFFHNDFSTSLDKSVVGEYIEVLDMVRLAPSASNKQPWRIVKVGGVFHFFEYKTPGYSKNFSYDIQRIDMGIGAVHFQLKMKDEGKNGYFTVLEHKISTPENIVYKFSWVGEGEAIMDKELKELKEIYLAGGCFWGTDKYLSLINGVIETEVGYANGNTENPTYQDVCYNNTGHTETVKLSYDPGIVSLDSILNLFYDVINPTSINKQGNDVGSQYRSGIYYTDNDDKEVILKSIEKLQEKYQEKIAIEVLALDNYTKAEEQHQKYLDKNPGGYCHIGQDSFRKVKDMSK